MTQGLRRVSPAASISATTSVRISRAPSRSPERCRVAVLVRETTEFAEKLSKVPVRSRLVRPHHDQKVRAYIRLAAAYQKLMLAYPREDFDAIRAGLKERESAMLELAAADLDLRRILRKYKRWRK